MKRLSLLLCALALAAAPLALSAQAQLSDVSKAMDTMLADYWQPNIQAAFGSITYSYTGLPSSFSRWVQDEIASKVISSKRITIFNKDAVVAMDPDFRGVYADFFKTNMVGGLISGKYFEEKNNIKVRIDLTDLSTGQLIGSTECLVSKKALPKGVPYLPEKSAQTMGTALGAILPSPAATPKPAASAAESAKPLTVSVATDRGKGGSYIDGEYLRLFVTVNKDAYVKIYHIDVAGKAQLIFPNSISRDNRRLEAGKLVTMGTEEDGFLFQLHEPFGTEFIKVIASTTPFSNVEKEFQELTGAVDKGIRSGSAAESGGEQAEALASYYIGSAF